MLHMYKFGGDNVVIDAGSGSVHVTDDFAYDVIGLVDGGMTRDEIATFVRGRYPDVTASDLDELFGDIETLRRSGQLFAEDATLLVEPEDGGGVIKALCLHVAHSCNLVCDYCFAGQGQYHGKTALMSFDVAKRAMDFLVENSGTRRNLEVDFFGGEPLLNFGVVKQTVAYARTLEPLHGKTFRFTLTTNGVLLDDDVTDFCQREISNVVLSLDGRPEMHDARRKTPSGGGSYGAIVPKLQRFAEKRGGNYYIRGTYTAANTDFLRDILHIADLGFTELAMEPAVLPRDHPLSLRESDLPTLYEQYEQLALEMRRREITGDSFCFYHYMLDLENGPCVVKRVRGCGAGGEYFAVTPDGTLYPCHQLAGETQFVAGDVFSGVNPDFSFRRTDVNSRAECRDCWAKLWCSGGCAANAYHDTGDVNGIHSFGCELFKKRLECAVWLAGTRDEG